MKIQYLMIPVVFAAMATHAAADQCSINIDSTDAMKFDTTEITVNKPCKEFTIHLHHSGKLGKNVMGHNVVIAKEADASAVASDGATAGMDNNYVKPGDARVIAFTEIIGGGEKTSVTFATEKLKDSEKYEFFCSFPGHIALMKGNVLLK